MKEELQKIRDEEADRYNNNPYLSIIQRMEVHDIWTDGFDRAVELMEERVKILEEALEFYAKAKILFCNKPNPKHSPTKPHPPIAKDFREPNRKLTRKKVSLSLVQHLC